MTDNYILYLLIWENAMFFKLFGYMTLMYIEYLVFIVTSFNWYNFKGY